jgi:hypothetical protein
LKKTRRWRFGLYLYPINDPPNPAAATYAAAGLRCIIEFLIEG